jgi:hypothetical protein
LIFGMCNPLYKVRERLFCPIDLSKHYPMTLSYVNSTPTSGSSQLKP